MLFKAIISIIIGMFTRAIFCNDDVLFHTTDVNDWINNNCAECVLSHLNICVWFTRSCTSVKRRNYRSEIVRVNPPSACCTFCTMLFSLYAIHNFRKLNKTLLVTIVACLLSHKCTAQCTFFQTTCKEETNECQNGGTMIWDPVKSFTCLCKEGYGGELCEKGEVHLYMTSQWSQAWNNFELPQGN